MNGIYGNLYAKCCCWERQGILLHLWRLEEKRAALIYAGLSGEYL